jgi:hypothetical protein
MVTMGSIEMDRDGSEGWIEVVLATKVKRYSVNLHLKVEFTLKL